MIKIKFSEEQFNILKEAVSAEHKFHIIHLDKIINNTYFLEATEDEICELHECCADYLPLVGFDENYDINKSGQLLESLIDKFHDCLENYN